MSDRPTNWQQRQYLSFGPHFRIESANPEMGLNGSIVYDLFAQSASGDKSVVGMSNGGLYHIYNDQCIEIVGGQEDDSCGPNIMLTAKTGDIWITAQQNGEVRIRGKKIVLDADEDLDLVAGNNIKIHAKNRILLESNVADCNALKGNLAPRDVTFLGQVYGGSKVGLDKIPSGGLIS